MPIARLLICLGAAVALASPALCAQYYIVQDPTTNTKPRNN